MSLGPGGFCLYGEPGALASSWLLFNTYALRTVTMPIIQNKAMPAGE